MLQKLVELIRYVFRSAFILSVLRSGSGFSIFVSREKTHTLCLLQMGIFESVFDFVLADVAFLEFSSFIFVLAATLVIYSSRTDARVHVVSVVARTSELMQSADMRKKEKDLTPDYLRCRSKEVGHNV